MNATIHARADYRSRFGNKRYTLEIVDSTSQVVSITNFNITPEGAVITYESTEQDVFANIISSTLNFSLICETQAQLDFLKGIVSSAIGRFGIRLLIANNNATPVLTKWVGTLISDQITFSDSIPQQVSFTATDDLGYLKDIPYLDENGNRFRGNQSIKEHIVQALSNLRTNWYYGYSIDIGGVPFFTLLFGYDVDLVPDSYVSANSVTKKLIDEAEISNLIFYKDDEDEDVLNCHEVLTRIFKYLNCSFYQTFDSNTVLFHMTSLGVFQKRAVTPTALIVGQQYRSNGANFLFNSLATNEVNITNDASNKKRLAGGTFSYLQPFRKVLRTLKVHEDETLFTRVFKEGPAQGAAVRPFNNLYQSNWHNFDQGEQIRLRFVFTTQWPGDAGFTGSTAAQTLFANIGGVGTPPDAFNIGRVVIRVVIQLLNEDEDGNSLGADQYAERVQSNGGQIPIYDTSYGFSSYPQFYTNHLATDDVAFTTSSTHISFTSDPFVISEAQIINEIRDFVLPPLPFATANGIKVKCEVDFLDHTGTIGQNSGTSLITNHSDPQVVMKMRAFSGFEPSNERRFTSINTGTGRKTKDTGEVFLNDGFSQSLGVLRYRKSDGSFSREETGFTSIMETTSTQPSAKLITSEMANYYGTLREMYEGTLIKLSGASLRTIYRLDHIETGGTTTIKYKATKLSLRTGFEETEVSLIEIARNTTSTTTFTDIISPVNPISSDDDINVGITDIGGVATIRSSLAQTVGPIDELTATAVTRNRSSQTGNAIAAIDANGVIQEITDGSNGQVLSTNGSGVYSFIDAGSGASVFMLASSSFRASMFYENRYYYGSSLYGWSIDTSFTTSSSTLVSGGLVDDHAHNLIIVPTDLDRLVFKSSIRNDTSAVDIKVFIYKASRPNGATSNLTVTQIGTGTAACSGGVNRHYNCDIDMTGLSISAGEGILVVLLRESGGNTSTLVNVTYSLLAIV